MDIDLLKPMSEWARQYHMNYSTAALKRRVAAVGTQVPPGTWMLSYDEWQTVRDTPATIGKVPPAPARRRRPRK